MTLFAYITDDNISTDLIHPPDFFSLNKDKRKQGLLYGYNQEWAETIEPGSIIIGGENFGCGSSREVTALVFSDRGIKLVCARSFARIFYRNMINLGIPLYTISTAIPWQTNSRVEIIHPDNSLQISDLNNNSISLDKPSSFTEKIIANGGLLHSIDDLFQPQHHV